MAGGGQGGGGMGGGQGAGGMGGGQSAGGFGGGQPGGGMMQAQVVPPGAIGGDPGNPIYAGTPEGDAFMARGNFGGGMGGLGGGYGMGSPFGGFGGGMPMYGGFGSPMGYGGGMGGFGGGFPGMGYGGGMGGFPGMGYGGGMGGFPGMGYGGGMGGFPGMGYGGGMGGFDGGMSKIGYGGDMGYGGFSRGMGSPFRGGFGGMRGGMRGGMPGGGQGPDTYDHAAFLAGTGSANTGVKLPAPGGGMAQIQGGPDRARLDQFNQALRGGFRGAAPLQITTRPAVSDVLTGGPAEVVQPAPDALTGGPAEVVNKGMPKPYFEQAEPAAPQIPTVPEGVPKPGTEAMSSYVAPRPFVPIGGAVGKPWKDPRVAAEGEYAAPFAGGDPNYKPLARNFTSAQDAYDRTLAHMKSPEYLNYYLSFAPSTRAYINSPEQAERAAQGARDYYMQYGNSDSFRFRAGGIASLLKRK